MLFHKSGSIEFLDQLYSLAFWMTGSLKNTAELVYKTYEQTGAHSSAFGLLKTFRKVYHEHADVDNPHSHSSSASDTAATMHRKQEVDIKLAVLFVELFGLQHLKISIIMEQPIETIRLWLSAGRKSLLDLIDGGFEPSLSC
ncbi:MAG: RNA polymerase subunit sigma-24 [Chlorobiales bacterium]|nr:RNA polymerase subunit sigma-24 [Chlorobiales bacterium]